MNDLVKMECAKISYPGFDFDLNLKLKPGTITGLLGVNGSGKTTAFRLICGLEKADSGNISTLGFDAFALPVSAKQKMGVVFADSGFPECFCSRNVKAVLKAYFPSFDAAFFDQKCREMKLSETKEIRDMSTGQKTKFKLICALSHHPDLLILDEPTVGLDILVRTEILGWLQDFMEQPGRSILISSHIASDLESLCDDFYLISQGKNVLHETTDKLLDEYGILKLDDDQKRHTDLRGVIAEQKTSQGWQLLVQDRNYYLENYPELIVEKGNIDDLLRLVEGSENEKTA